MPFAEKKKEAENEAHPKVMDTVGFDNKRISQMFFQYNPKVFENTYTYNETMPPTWAFGARKTSSGEIRSASGAVVGYYEFNEDAATGRSRLIFAMHDKKFLEYVKSMNPKEKQSDSSH